MDKRLLSNRIGEKNYNYQNLEMEIIEYNNRSNITVMFEDGEILKNKRYDHFKDGSIKNYNVPTVYGNGIVGNNNVGMSKSKPYLIWYEIMQRCFDEKLKNRHPTYKECKISDEFLYFENFKNFYYDNIWGEGLKLSPDKDILSHGKQKIYSRDTILFVDARINMLFLKNDKNRGNLPIGVGKKNSKYISRISILNDNGISNRIQIGTFDTVDEAFLAYKTEKEKYIKQVADDYKRKYSDFPDKIYNAMYEYEVLRTD